MVHLMIPMEYDAGRQCAHRHRRTHTGADDQHKKRRNSE
jgi:hypothetical protein